MEMRWRTKDSQKLSAYIRKFNTSITKMSRRFPELADAGIIPTKLSAKEIRESEISRKDFNRLIQKIDRWFKPKQREVITRNGIKMTRWEYQNALNNAQVINTQRKVMRERAGISGRQKQQVGEDKSVSRKLQDLQERIHQDEYSEFTPEMARESWVNFTKTLEKQSKDSYYHEQSIRFYDNYHTAIYENFSDDNARDLANFLEDFRLTGDELFDIIGRFPYLDIDYMYGPEEEEGKMDLIMNTLPRAVKELKGKEWAEKGIERFYKRVPGSSLEYRFELER